MRTEGGDVDGGGQGAQGLVGADVARGLLATDVLLARPERHDERPAAIDVSGHAHQTAWDLPDQCLAAGQDPKVRAAVCGRDAERLPFRGGDVGAVGARCGEDGERYRLYYSHGQRAGGMGEARDLRHRLEQAEEAGIGDDHARNWIVGVGEQPFQGREVRRAGRRTVRDERDLVGDERRAAEVGAERLAVMGMDAAAHQNPLSPRGPAAHQSRLGRGGRTVVVRGRDHVQAGQFGHKGLVFVDRLECALADLRLVGRVGGIELAPQKKLVDDRRHEMTVDTGTEETDEVDAIRAGETPQVGAELRFGFGRGQIQAGGTQRRRNVGEQVIDGRNADLREHAVAIVGRVRAV